MATGNVYSVGQVNGYIKGLLANEPMLRQIRVRGEVSNCTHHRSGHIYFTLKDASGTLSCVMFASSVRGGLSFKMDDCDEVIVTGRIDVYPQGGRYQLYASRIERAGLGALAAQVEELKARLGEMGMFDAQYKQPIPRYIRRLGVVTAPTGAAVHDIINIAGRRNPGVQIILYPALVQGEGAPVSVANGIHALDALQDIDPAHKVDVIIVGRGGGSLEDLMAFNSELVAQAIFDCRTPIISAVGHETDTTIADYVADLRAPTPSAGAELAVYDAATYLAEVNACRDRMQNMLDHHVSTLRRQAEAYQKEFSHLSPMSKVRNQRMQLDALWTQLAGQMETTLREHRERLRDADRLQVLMEARIREAREQLRIADRMAPAMRHTLETRRNTLALCAAGLDRLSPLKRLSGSYGFVTQDDGRALTGAAQVQAGDKVLIRMKDGRIHTVVTETEMEGLHG